MMVDIQQLERDFHEMQRQVALLDGWRQGESERYGRLERDVAGIKDEMRLMRTDLRQEMKEQRTEIMGRIDEQSVRMDRLETRLDGLQSQFNRMLWLMLGMLTTMVVQFAYSVGTG